VNSVSGVRLAFKDAVTYPGRSYRVTDAGGTGKMKVSVEFTNPGVPYKATEGASVAVSSDGLLPRLIGRGWTMSDEPWRDRQNDSMPAAAPADP